MHAGRGQGVYRARTVARVAAAALSAAAAGCPLEPTPPVDLTVRFEAVAGGDVVGPGAPRILLPGAVTIDTALLWVGDLRVIADVAEVEDGMPFPLDLLDAASSGRSIPGAPPGLYSRLRAEARPVNIEVAEEFPKALSNGEEGYSIRLSGTVEGVPFDYQETATLVVDVRKVVGLEVGPGECASFLVRIDVARWFQGIDFSLGELDEGVLRIDDEHNPDLLDAVRDAFEAEGTVTVEGFAGSC